MQRKKPLIPNQNKKNKALKVNGVSFYEGPIPTPEMLNHYNMIQPDFADRIMRMAEKDQERAIKTEMRNTNFGYFITTVGLLFAFFITAGLIYSLYLAITSENTKAVQWIMLCMASVGGIFLFRKTK